MALDDFFSLKIIQAAAVIIGAWIVATFLPKLIHKIDDKSDAINFSNKTHDIIKKVTSFLTYLTALVVLVYLSGFDKTLSELFSTKSIEAKGVQLILIWLGTFIFVKYLATAFKQLDDAIKEIDLSEHFHSLLQKTLNYIAYTIALVLSLNVLELTSLFTAMLAGAGVAGIVIGFAAKDVFSNLLGGIFIVLDRPFKIGDTIEVKGANTTGTVREISLRSTEIVTTDNTHIFVPNALIATNPVVNFSIEKTRMLELTVGIDYNSDQRRAAKAIKDSLQKLPFIVQAKPLEVISDLFADSAINLRIRMWVDTKQASLLEAKTHAIQTINDTLKQEKIDIPYPQRVIRHVYEEKPIKTKKNQK